MRLVIFEDYYYSNFAPLAHFRPLFDLYTGAGKTWERLASIVGIPKNEIAFFGRKNQLEWFLERYSLSNPMFNLSTDVLFVNARLLDYSVLAQCEPDTCFTDSAGELILFRLSEKTLPRFTPKGAFDHTGDTELKNYLTVKGKCKSAGYLYELIPGLSERIATDILGRTNGASLFIDPAADVRQPSVLDTDSGPIYIAAGARISPFTEIRGPAFIGANSTVDRAYLHDGVVIGEKCRVSGEIEASIISDYSNKHHTGFLGHSILGEWVNIGAMATTSDLKNNYSPIKIQFKNKLVNTGEIKLGSFFGDHVKVSIGIMINCGTIIGEGSVVFDSIAEKSVPPLSWGSDKRYEPDLFSENCSRIMKRRGIDIPTAYRRLVNDLFSSSGS